MAHSPLTLREAMRTPLGVALLLLSVLTLVYSVVIIGQLLVGLWSVTLLAAAYLIYRVLAVLDSIADAAQRFAAVREHEAGLDGSDRRESQGRREREHAGHDSAGGEPARERER